MTSVAVQGLDSRSPGIFRSAAVVCAALLGMQCIWLVLPELVRPKILQLPTSAAAASLAAKHRDDATWAASVGQIRGDLWAEAAFTQASLLWQTTTTGNEDLQRARSKLDRAVRNAPHTSGAWLMLANLAPRFGFSKSDAVELLKLSYYTGPSERALVPLRLETAIRLDGFGDSEMGQLIARDIRSLLAQKQDAAIVAIYNTASASAKSFMQQTIQDIDPSAADKIRAGGQK